MPLIRFLQLVSLGVFLTTDKSGGAAPPCRPNWFGSPCRYECHCVNSKCDANGECTEPLTCERGWFGPSCQYVDLVSTSALLSTPAWVFDFPDTMCNPGQEKVTVSLNDIYYFTWLRLGTKSILSPQEFKLQLITSNSTSVECSGMCTSAVSDTTVDIHCQQAVPFQKLIITGDGVKSLCSVYISGGRNVALGQDTTQTSDYDFSFSWRAVDGDRNPVFTHKSCSHTNLGDSTPTWKLSFQRPHYVNRYVIYNRDIHQERLRGFILEAYKENSNVAFIYTDLTTINQSVYRIQSTAPQTPVSSVIIIATETTINNAFLTLCEVEMFGDTACPAGQYGRECENRCNCAEDGENCFVSTGGCPSGCAAGYHGEGCHNPCSPTYYGENCILRCSSNCVGRLCNATNGSCGSCMVGRAGLFCDEACPDATFGEDCREICSTNCSSQLCDPVTGQCTSCVQGSHDDYCNHTLPLSEPGGSPPIAAIVGPVVGFFVLAALIVTGAFIWRRRKNTKDDHEQTTPRRFQNYTESDSTGTGKSKTVATKADSAHVKPSVRQQPNHNQYSPDIHTHNVSGVYYNFVPSLRETPVVSSGQDSSVADTRQKYQEQFNDVPTSNSTTIVARTEQLNCDKHTNSHDYSPYEIRMDSTAVIQKSQQIKSEDCSGYASFDTANPYESIDDTMPNPYEDIDDM